MRSASGTRPSGAFVGNVHALGVRLLREAGIAARESCRVTAIERLDPAGFRLETPQGPLRAARLLRSAILLRNCGLARTPG